MVRSAVCVFPTVGTATLSNLWIRKKSQKCWSIYTADCLFGTGFVFWPRFAIFWAIVPNTTQFR